MSSNSQQPGSRCTGSACGSESTGNKITLVPGPIVRLAADGTRFVVHACPVGRWTSELAGTIARHWPEGQTAFVDWAKRGQQIGEVQYFWYMRNGEPETWIVSMIVRDDKNVILPDHLEHSLGKVARRAVELGASVHMRAGIIDKHCDVAAILAGVPTYLYSSGANK